MQQQEIKMQKYIEQMRGSLLERKPVVEMMHKSTSTNYTAPIKITIPTQTQ